MTNRQRIEKLENIQDSLGGIFDQLYDDYATDKDTERAVEKVAEELDNLIEDLKSRYQVETSITPDTNLFICNIKLGGQEHESCYQFIPKQADRMMMQICEILAGKEPIMTRVVTIIYRGQELEFVGPQPGHVYEFRNKETGEMAWWGKFPGWGLEK